MSRAGVLAAAVALGRFTLPELTAYCDEEIDAVAGILGDCAGLVAQDGPHWQVLDAAEIRRRLRPAEAPAEVPAERRWAAPDEPRVLAARMLLAEQTLLDCVDEPSPDTRRTMAATAENHLRYVAAAVTATTGRWWEVDLDRDADSVEVEAAGTLITTARLRVGAALSRLTSSEATGAEVALTLLADTARYVGELGEAAGESRSRALVDRFLDLARAVAGPLRRLSTDQTAAPVRLLTAIAWLRASGGTEDLGRVSTALQLLETLRKREPLVADPSSCLFQVLGTLPDGRSRVTVYADLLQALPRQYECRSTDVLLPGALVEAVADETASDHLQHWASRLETDLLRSPFRSDSALIGQTAHLLEDMAAGNSGLDTSVLPRADRTRSELLSLADVRV